MATSDLSVTLARDIPRGTRSTGTRPLGPHGLGTRPLDDPLGEDDPRGLSPAMSSKIRGLIAKLRGLLAMVPPELRGKIMGLIATAEGALAGFWIGDLAALVSLMERTVLLLNQLAGWGDIRDLRALATRAYWDRRRILTELNQLLADVESRGVDSLRTRREADPIASLASMIDARF